jgi:hypothetical protein
MYLCIAMAIKMSRKVGDFFHPCLLACRPGGRWGNTERVVNQWQHPGASSVALDLLHWVMPRVLLQRICMAIKMACNGEGTFVCCCRLFCLLQT